MLSLDPGQLFWLLLTVFLILNSQRILRKEIKTERQCILRIEGKLLDLQMQVKLILEHIHFKNFVEEFTDKIKSGLPSEIPLIQEKKRPGRPKKNP